MSFGLRVKENEFMIRKSIEFCENFSFAYDLIRVWCYVAFYTIFRSLICLGFALSAKRHKIIKSLKAVSGTYLLTYSVEQSHS